MGERGEDGELKVFPDDKSNKILLLKSKRNQKIVTGGKK